MTVMTRRESYNVKVRDLNVSYYDEGDGPVLLLIHGFTGGKLDFHDQMSWFTDRFRVVAPDNRGHGETSNPGEGYEIDNMVADLHGFIEALNLSDVHLLGHSLGGMIAMRYAIAHPDELASLILMDTASMPLDMPRDYFDIMEKTLRENGAETLVAMMKKAPKTQEVQNGIDFLGQDEHWSRISEKLNQMDPTAYASLGRELADLPDITDQLAAISCPATIMVGVADAPFLGPSDAMHAAIIQSELEIIDDASHCPQYENAQVWKQVINRHLQRALS